MSSEGDPSAYFQWGGIVGTFLLGLWAAVWGTKKSIRRKYDPDEAAATIRELQFQLDNQKMRTAIADEFITLEASLRTVIESLRISTNDQFNELKHDIHEDTGDLREKVHQLEVTVARLTR